MPEQRKRLQCVVEITQSTTFLFASEVPAITAFAGSGLHQETNLKTREFWRCGFLVKLPLVTSIARLSNLCMIRSS